MAGIKWDHHITAKGGQSIKQQKGKAPAVVNKNTEMNLKITLSSSTEDLDGAVRDIVEKIDGLDKVTLVFSGPELHLKQDVKTIAAIVADYGNQDTLEAYTKEDSAVIPLES